MPPSLLARLDASIKATRLIWSRSGTGGGWQEWRGSLWGDPTAGPVNPSPSWAGCGISAYDAKAAAGNLRYNSVAQACMAWINRTFPEPRMFVSRSQEDETKEIKGHPLTKLLRRPNPYFSGDRQWQATLPDLWFEGNAYWFKQRDRGGRVVELWQRPACQVRPVRDSPHDYISRYVYRVDGKDQDWSPADVVHFRFGVDPENDMKGWSPLAAAIYEIGNLNNGSLYRGGLLANMGVPAYGLSTQDKDVAQWLMSKTQEFFDGVRNMFRAVFSRGGAGGLFIPSFPGKLERLGFSPEELDVAGMLARDADIVCALFGLSAMAVNLPSGDNQRTYANWGEALRSAYQGNIKPTHRLVAEELEIQLLPDVSKTPDAENVEWDYSDIDAFRETEMARRKDLRDMKVAGILTADEVRAEIGKDPLTSEQRSQMAPKLPPGFGQPLDSRGDQAAAQNGGGAAPNGNGRARELAGSNGVAQ